jgi:hypothetical protein
VHVDSPEKQSLAVLEKALFAFNYHPVSLDFLSGDILIRRRTAELFLRKTFLDIDPLVLMGIVLAIGIALAVLAFLFYRRSFARREATQPPPRPPPTPQ